MRVLLDEQLPRRLAREIAGHEVRTVQQQGWGGLSNGELLRRAVADGFNVFVTADRNLEYQQNIAGHAISVIVLVAPSIAIEDLQPLVPKLLAAIAVAEAGKVVRDGDLTTRWSGLEFPEFGGRVFHGMRHEQRSPTWPNESEGRSAHGRQPDSQSSEAAGEGVR